MLSTLQNIDLIDLRAEINIRTIEDILNTIPQTCHVEMGRRYLTDLINVFFHSSLTSKSLQAKEMKVPIKIPITLFYIICFSDYL